VKKEGRKRVYEREVLSFSLCLAMGARGQRVSSESFIGKAKFGFLMGN